jgi:methylated-DNA-[protein]-cysteine S-methyltransferase
MTKIPAFDASCSFESEIGPISLYAKDEAVVFLTMGHPAATNSGKSKVLTEASKQLKAYFSGRSKVLNFTVAANGTEFQESVWGQIAKLGFGETASYAEIAEAIGNPKAVRAVGGAVGANTVPLVIGCYRVLGANGQITGYSGGDGIPTKTWLLNHEGIEVKP